MSTPSSNRTSSQKLLRITHNLTYAEIFICLLLFSVWSIIYVDRQTDSQSSAPVTLTTPNVTAQAITCGFPASGTYGAPSVFIYYLLLPATVILRQHEWLATVTAASALTYSSVAALHIFVIFLGHNQFTLDTAAPCLLYSLDGNSAILPICEGQYDPDYRLAFNVVSAGLLTVLPISAWSSTFRKKNSYRSILVMWTFLLALGHVFVAIIVTNPYRNYQICTVGYTEPLPGPNYQAPILNDNWLQQLEAMVTNQSTVQQQCLYTCYATDQHLGRIPNEIQVYDLYVSEPALRSRSRSLYIAFWVIYPVLAVPAVFLKHDTTRDERCLSLSKTRWWTWKIVKPILLLRACRRCLAELAIQVISVSAFIIFVVYAIIASGNIPLSENLSAVGQWGAIATAVITLAAAGVSWVAEKWETG